MKRWAADARQAGHGRRPSRRSWFRKLVGATRKLPDPTLHSGREWVQVSHGYSHRAEVGWIPRDVLEGMGIDCSPLDKQVPTLTGSLGQGTVWFTREQSEKIHRHPEFEASNGG